LLTIWFLILSGPGALLSLSAFIALSNLCGARVWLMRAWSGSRLLISRGTPSCGMSSALIVSSVSWGVVVRSPLVIVRLLSDPEDELLMLRILPILAEA
jgi:hypothetical protein